MLQPGTDFRYHVGHYGEVLIVLLLGSMSADAGSGFRELMGRYLRTGNERVVLDCEELTHLSPHALHLLLAMARRLEAGRGRLVVCNLVPRLRELFELSGLHRDISILDSLNDALLRVQREG